ncbi:MULTISPECIES: mycothione reductase [Pseudonocardia]|uniref:Mycothione reductase n=2 Tax=Pseudonocardia TaxID=1847 RepID=A0A1Y2N1H7_PSEAH|nr:MULTISPECIES: mycothione reductase [Pseudonocardia]OSY41262.1 Mycothione reductase [Pseudonocardia autotrophica]TDN76717.1 mycothione reductase [Pseudonocardia autotrophica]BBG00719.1 mycothione reductase [Pseudonocardia autotrophica]GEC24315.1 mycothione reductase [Pseudonocardia saturnea]
MSHHDLVVIGTGSGNTFLDERFAGLDVALVEHGVFGGTCLNVGCIPTKMYVYAADVAETVRHAHTYGVDASVDKIRWTDIRDRVFGRIDPISAGGREYRVERSPNVTVYFGHARFTGERELAVDRTDGSGTDVVTADRVVLAAGSRPTVPAAIEASGVPFETSDTVMRIDAVPRRLAIVGSGFIGSEFAHVFSALGAEVTVIARGPRLLRHLDDTLSERFTEIAAARWDCRLGRQVTALSGDGSGGSGEVTITLDDGSEVVADTLLVATGRIPNGDRMDLDRAGITMHADGRVAVDEFQRSVSAENVWALGDVSSPHQLKHVANHEAKIVGHNLSHPSELRATNHDLVPSAVFTEPQIASVGLTETEAREQGLDVTVKVQNYGDVAYGWAMEDRTGLCKIVAEKGTGRLLGAHILGPQASTLIQQLIQAMVFGQDARALATEQYWIHPALPEVVENALLGLEI